MSRNGTSAIYKSLYYSYAKLAIERRLRGVSTYLPDPEAPCSKHVRKEASQSFMECETVTLRIGAARAFVSICCTP